MVDIPSGACYGNMVDIPGKARYNKTICIPPEGGKSPRSKGLRTELKEKMITFLSFSGWEIQVIISLIAIDVVLGIIAAFVKKEFEWKKLANFMKGPVLWYVLGFSILQSAGETMTSMSSVVTAAFVLIIITLLASIFRNLNRLGIPVPDGLKK